MSPQERMRDQAFRADLRKEVVSNRKAKRERASEEVRVTRGLRPVRFELQSVRVQA